MATGWEAPILITLRAANKVQIRFGEWWNGGGLRLAFAPWLGQENEQNIRRDQVKAA